MNRQLLKAFTTWPKPYIFGADMHYLLGGSPDSRHSIVKREVQEKRLVPIRRDLYLIQDPNKGLVNAFEISSLAYGPSYVSFESALSFHGWIPEAVRTTTCATVKRSKQFDSAIGTLSYEHIPIEVFYFGVEQHEQKGCTLFIASPLKALADLVYSRKRIYHSVDDILEDLRIEPESLQTIDQTLLKVLIEHYPNSRVKNTLQMMMRK